MELGFYQSVINKLHKDIDNTTLKNHKKRLYIEKISDVKNRIKALKDQCLNLHRETLSMEEVNTSLEQIRYKYKLILSMLNISNNKNFKSLMNARDGASNIVSTNEVNDSSLMSEIGKYSSEIYDW